MACKERRSKDEPSASRRLAVLVLELLLLASTLVHPSEVSTYLVTLQPRLEFLNSPNLIQSLVLATMIDVVEAATAVATDVTTRTATEAMTDPVTRTAVIVAIVKSEATTAAIVMAEAVVVAVAVVVAAVAVAVAVDMAAAERIADSIVATNVVVVAVAVVAAATVGMIVANVRKGPTDELIAMPAVRSVEIAMHLAMIDVTLASSVSVSIVPTGMLPELATPLPLVTPNPQLDLRLARHTEVRPSYRTAMIRLFQPSAANASSRERSLRALRTLFTFAPAQ